MKLLKMDFQIIFGNTLMKDFQKIKSFLKIIQIMKMYFVLLEKLIFQRHEYIVIKALLLVMMCL